MRRPGSPGRTRPAAETRAPDCTDDHDDGPSTRTTPAAPDVRPPAVTRSTASRHRTRSGAPGQAGRDDGRLADDDPLHRARRARAGEDGQQPVAARGRLAGSRPEHGRPRDEREGEHRSEHRTSPRPVGRRPVARTATARARQVAPPARAASGGTRTTTSAASQATTAAGRSRTSTVRGGSLSSLSSTGRGPGHTRTRSRSRSSRVGPMPATSASSSTDPNGRSSRCATIRPASTGPMPGSASRAASSAPLRSSSPSASAASAGPPPAGCSPGPGHGDLLAVHEQPCQVEVAQLGVAGRTPGRGDRVDHPRPLRQPDHSRCGDRAHHVDDHLRRRLVGHLGRAARGGDGELDRGPGRGRRRPERDTAADQQHDEPGRDREAPRHDPPDPAAPWCGTGRSGPRAPRRTRPRRGAAPRWSGRRWAVRPARRTVAARRGQTGRPVRRGAGGEPARRHVGAGRSTAPAAVIGAGPTAAPGSRRAEPRAGRGGLGRAVRRCGEAPGVVPRAARGAR